jgi:hypothetical protein
VTLAAAGLAARRSRFVSCPFVSLFALGNSGSAAMDLKSASQIMGAEVSYDSHRSRPMRKLDIHEFASLVTLRRSEGSNSTLIGPFSLESE